MFLFDESLWCLLDSLTACQAAGGVPRRTAGSAHLNSVARENARSPRYAREVPTADDPERGRWSRPQAHG